MISVVYIYFGRTEVALIHNSPKKNPFPFHKIWKVFHIYIVLKDSEAFVKSLEEFLFKTLNVKKEWGVETYVSYILVVISISKNRIIGWTRVGFSQWV